MISLKTQPDADESVEQAAKRLARAAADRTPCAPVRDLIKVNDLETAYQVQETLTRARLDGGRRLVGRKIGLTSLGVQKQLGVDQPDYGMLFDDMGVAIGETIDMARLMQPKIEAEIAFVLRSGLDDERLTVADILGAVDYALPALEVVDSRIADWDISIVDTIADNASSGLFVLGDRPVPLRNIDMRGAKMRMINTAGDTVSSGDGAACLGSPVTACLWLARTMAAAGRPLAAGDIVLSGALGPMAPVRAGDCFTAEIEGLGSVSAAFAEEDQHQ